MKRGDSALTKEPYDIKCGWASPYDSMVFATDSEYQEYSEEENQPQR